MTSRIGRRPNKDWQKARKALAKGQSPPQELEVSPSRELYVLVNNVKLNLRDKLVFTARKIWLTYAKPTSKGVQIFFYLIFFGGMTVRLSITGLTMYH